MAVRPKASGTPGRRNRFELHASTVGPEAPDVVVPLDSEAPQVQSGALIPEATLNLVADGLPAAIGAGNGAVVEVSLADTTGIPPKIVQQVGVAKARSATPPKAASPQKGLSPPKNGTPPSAATPPKAGSAPTVANGARSKAVSKAVEAGSRGRGVSPPAAASSAMRGRADRQPLAMRNSVGKASGKPASPAKASSLVKASPSKKQASPNKKPATVPREAAVAQQPQVISPVIVKNTQKEEVAAVENASVSKAIEEVAASNSGCDASNGGMPAEKEFPRQQSNASNPDSRRVSFTPEMLPEDASQIKQHLRPQEDVSTSSSWQAVDGSGHATACTVDIDLTDIGQDDPLSATSERDLGGSSVSEAPPPRRKAVNARADTAPADLLGAALAAMQAQGVVQPIFRSSGPGNVAYELLPEADVQPTPALAVEAAEATQQGASAALDDDEEADIPDKVCADLLAHLRRVRGVEQELVHTRSENSTLQQLLHDVWQKVRQLECSSNGKPARGSSAAAPASTSATLQDTHARLLDIQRVLAAAPVQLQSAAPDEGPRLVAGPESRGPTTGALLEICTDLLGRLRNSRETDKKAAKLQAICKEVQNRANALSSVLAGGDSGVAADPSLVSVAQKSLADIQALLAAAGDNDAARACSTPDGSVSVRSVLRSPQQGIPISPRMISAVTPPTPGATFLAASGVYYPRGQSPGASSIAAGMVRTPRGSQVWPSSSSTGGQQMRLVQPPADAHVASHANMSMRLAATSAGEERTTSTPGRAPSPCPQGVAKMLPRLPEQLATIERTVLLPDRPLSGVATPPPGTVRVRQHYRQCWTLEREERIMLPGPVP